MKHKAIIGVLLKTVLPLVVGLVVMVVVIAWMSGFFKEKIEPGETAADRIMAPTDPNLRDKVHEVQKEYFEEAVGTLRASSRTEISSRVMATITKLNVTAGSVVNEGDKLVELDPRQLETQLSQAQAGLVAAQAEVDDAKTDYERNARLIEQNATSRQQFDSAKRRRDVAEAQLAHAQQVVTEAEVLRSYATIRAPKAGMVVDRLAEEGDNAQPGVPLLVLYDPASLRLEVPVMENLAVRLKQGQTLRVVIDAVGAEVPATVDEIVPQAQAASRSFLVKVKVPRSKELFEGMYGRLLIPAGIRRHLCLATAAIDTIGQLEFVSVIRPDGSLERRFIKTGRLGMPGRVEVLSGLKAGEDVLLRYLPEPAPATSGAPEQSAFLVPLTSIR